MAGLANGQSDLVKFHFSYILYTEASYITTIYLNCARNICMDRVINEVFAIQNGRLILSSCQ